VGVGTAQAGSASGGDGPSFSTGGGPGPGKPGPHQARTEMSVGPDGMTFTIDRGKLTGGQKLYVTTADGTFTSIGVAIGDRAPAPVCAP
jgi:hypothetical protein